MLIEPALILWTVMFSSEDGRSMHMYMQQRFITVWLCYHRLSHLCNIAEVVLLSGYSIVPNCPIYSHCGSQLSCRGFHWPTLVQSEARQFCHESLDQSHQLPNQAVRYWWLSIPEWHSCPLVWWLHWRIYRGGGGGSGVAAPPPPNGPSHSIKCSTTDVLSHADALIYIAKCLVIVVVKF